MFRYLIEDYSVYYHIKLILLVDFILITEFMLFYFIVVSITSFKHKYFK